MLDDIKKSVNEIIYERTTSPLFGTLIISWLIWNWRILYLTFFISENKIRENKIDFILANYSDIHHIITFPLISSFVLLTIIPFISNGAYWLSLKFNKWKIDQKNIVDKMQLLTLEQSIEIRGEISKQGEKFAKLIEDKNLEIAQLNTIISDHRVSQHPNQHNFDENHQNSNDELTEIAENIKTNPERLKEYDMMVQLIQGEYTLVDRRDVTPKTIAFFESNDIIDTKGNGVYKFTDKGKKLLKIMTK